MNVRKLTGLILFAGLVISVSICRAEEGSHRLGIGANYWKTVRDLDLQNIEKKGLSWIATYQYSPGSPLSLECDLEYFNKGFAGTAKDVFAPQAYIVLGTHLYGALGIGKYYTDGEFTHDPFYALRLGIDFKLLPSIYMDINANYRFSEWKKISEMAKDIDSDTITIGAAVRMEF